MKIPNELCAVAAQITTSPEAKRLFEELVENEIVELCSTLRVAVQRRDWHQASEIEGRIQSMEGLWGTLRQTAAKYKPPQS